MKNGKQPITPSMWTKCGEGADDYQPLKDGQKTGYETKFGGLTKREYFAGLAMQGLLANPNGGMTAGSSPTFSPNGVSELALFHADALLARLEKTGDLH